MSKEFYNCPKCKSDNLRAHNEEYDVDVMWRIVECRDCGFQWQEVYEFLHSTTLDTAEELDDDGNPV